MLCYHGRVIDRRVGFTRRVAERMSEVGVTQAELGRAIGASQNTVSRFLRGRGHLSIDQLVPLEQVLGWPWGTAARLLGLVPDTTALPDDLADAIARARLDERDRRLLLDVHQVVVEQGLKATTRR